MFALVIALAVAPAAEPPLVAHEWGTFTMVIDTDGTAIDWFKPLLTEPLPAFVHRVSRVPKERLDFKVRMETPVIYFHSQEPLTVDVRVEFPLGQITETYPLGVRGTGDRNPHSWTGLRVDPALEPRFPRELGGDHYYAARAVAATPLELTRADGVVERERFVFYRGVGDFELPLRAKLDGARLRIANEGSESYGAAFLFERRGERATLRPLGELRPGAVSLIDLSSDALEPRVDLAALEDALVADGLFRDEAAAMIETWRSSWFEEGMRLLFTMPRAKIDELLPLSITPAARIERVFVGRYELVSEAARAEILALGSELERGDLPADRMADVARKYGRYGYAVLIRHANELGERGDWEAYGPKFLAALRFVNGQIARHESELGQTPAQSASEQ
jgi:hypothetical protein